MNLFKFRTLMTACLCSLAITTCTAAPPAHAGILHFLASHLFGSANSRSKKKKTSHRHLVRRNSSKQVSAIAKLPPRYTDTLSLPNSGSNPVTPDDGAPIVGKQLLSRSAPSANQQNDNQTDVLYQSQRSYENNDHAFSTRASWYGPGFDGKRTASGARYNQYGLTAASRTLPLGSRLLVANPKTGKCCTVTINDRGPYVSGRDIDLSKGAAGRIGVTGVSPVVCVAYADPQESQTALDADIANRANTQGRHSGRSRRHLTASAPPEHMSKRVLHLVAGIL